VSEGLDAARAALADRRAWLVGGAIRDRQLRRSAPSPDPADLDLVVEGDPAEAAQAIARAAPRAAWFALAEDFGTWRVEARDHSWQLDVEPLRGGSLEADLALRDFTVNAIAEPLEGGALIDPLDGLADLAARRLRMGAPQAFANDPLRVLRLVRMAVELGLEPEPQTRSKARAQAEELRRVSGERIFGELRRIFAAPRARRGLELMHELGATAVVLPELEALRGVEQNRFHHRDVYGHTVEVLDATISLVTACEERAPDPAGVIGEHRDELAALLQEPLGDGLDRGEALRWGALLHDVAKPLVRAIRPEDGRVTFIGHDVRGAAMARAVLERLRASERLRAHVAAMVRDHLLLGQLVHEPQPLARRTVFRYLRTSSPVAVDVTLLSVADRLATRGDRARESIDAHIRVARGLLVDALRWHAAGPPPPLLRGDDLIVELAVPKGPQVGELLGELAEAQYAGELSTREQALAYARELIATSDRPLGFPLP
jgi:putative nucleotidyltransferase with HDIG domain